MVSFLFSKRTLVNVFEAEMSTILTKEKRDRTQEAAEDWLCSCQTCLIFICFSLSTPGMEKSNLPQRHQGSNLEGQSTILFPYKNKTMAVKTVSVSKLSGKSRDNRMLMPLQLVIVLFASSYHRCYITIVIEDFQ